eukprot:c11848_g1_i2.p1 GENE.c11848_g1_i2~~c11848_g1_i2.p1  ORF type:complete len:322 (+),score=88.78 c11848_g1_i2:94-966(+)
MTSQQGIHSLVSYEEAMTALQDMFRDVDKDILHMMLTDRKGHLESTIEDLLAMTQENVAAEAQLARTANTSQQGQGGSAQLEIHPHAFLTEAEKQQLASDEALARALQDELFLEKLLNDEEFKRALAADAKNKAGAPVHKSRAANKDQPPTTGQVLSDATTGLRSQLQYMGGATRSMFNDMRNRFLASTSDAEPSNARYVVVPAPHKNHDDDDDDTTTTATNAHSSLPHDVTSPVQLEHPHIETVRFRKQSSSQLSRVAMRPPNDDDDDDPDAVELEDMSPATRQYKKGQ